MHTLTIENRRNSTATTNLVNFIDNISIVPRQPDFKANKINISCSMGATVWFSLDAGAAHGGKDYWIWMCATGNAPGLPLSGFTVPLNMDPLFLFGLMNPNFGGSTGFLGTLDASGQASAWLTLPSDPQMLYVGLPLHFAYVLTAPGPKLPISFVSHPVHLKYVP